MLASFLMMSAIMLVILTVSVLHMPLWLRRIIYYVPAWLQSAILHFGYAAWLGGVTGHVVGSLPGRAVVLPVPILDPADDPS